MKLTEAATLDRKSGEAEGSAVQRTITGNVEYDAQIELSSRPERTPDFLPRCTGHDHVCGFH